MKTFVTLSLAILVWLLPASSSSAAVVSWGFSGVITELYNESNALPANITVGMPFSGFVSYDTAVIAENDANPSPSKGDYYFRTNFTITVTVGGVTFSPSNTPSSSVVGGVNLSDNLVNTYDALSYWTSDTLLINGAPLPPSITDGGVEIVLNDYTKSSFTSDALPTFVPNLAAYSNPVFSASAFAQGAQNNFFYIGGEITEISPLPKVILSSQKLAGNQLRLSWPKSATGLTLQFATSLATQNWTTEPASVVDTATEHTVTVSTAGQPKFFRLVKFP